MSYFETLAAHKDQAISEWTEAIFAMYPLETAGFFRTQTDRFANPVAHATVQAVRILYDAITGLDVDTEHVQKGLHDLTRMRAVQDLRPDQAIGVLFLIKPILRKLFLTDTLIAGSLDSFLAMESRVDSLALMAFTLYCTDREAVYAQRVQDAMRERSVLMRLAAKRGESLPDCD